MRTISIVANQVNWTRRAASGSWVRAAAPVFFSAACLTQCRIWNLPRRRMFRVRGKKYLCIHINYPPVSVIDVREGSMYSMLIFKLLSPSSSVWSEVVHGAKRHTASLQDRGWLSSSSRQLAMAGQPPTRWWTDVWRGPSRQLLGGHCSSLFCRVSVYVCLLQLK